MNKQEAFKFIREKRGFVPYIGIFDIFNETEEIPQDIIDKSIEPLASTDRIFICSAPLAKLLNTLEL